MTEHEVDKKKSSFNWKKWGSIIIVQICLLLFGVFFGVRLNAALQGKTEWLDVSLLFIGFILMMGGFYTIEKHVKKRALRKMQTISSDDDRSGDIFE